jgi:hypothetical protein
VRLFLTLFRAMDKFSKDEIENWKKVKEALEKAGKTDCHFYTRAVAILSTGRDPMQW